MTSFSYFRLLQRLNSATGKSILVPGAFAHSNFALPIASDPISSRVLSNLCVGLLSECITGTPLAVLSEIGLFYAAFSVHHLRVRDFKHLDAERVVLHMGSLKCWLENPKTSPAISDVKAFCQQCFGEEAVEIPRSLSSGPQVFALVG